MVIHAGIHESIYKSLQIHLGELNGLHYVKFVDYNIL